MRTVYGLGTVHAEREYQLTIGIAANMKKLCVREGEDVEIVSADLAEGDILRYP